MKVKDCMTKNVVTVKRSTTLSELISIFSKHNFHTLPVVEGDNKIVGVITFEDIMKVFQPYNQQLAKMLAAMPFADRVNEEEDILLADISSEMGILVIVDDLMNTHFVTVDPDMSINEARSLMKTHDAQRLPVQEKGVLVGIISLFDIILSVFKQNGVI